MNMCTSKIAPKKIFLSLLLVFSAIVSAEENNPCLHNWGDIQYECNVSPKLSGNGDMNRCGVTPDEAKSRARSIASYDGSCKRYKVCRNCGERENLSNHSVNKSVGSISPDDTRDPYDNSHLAGRSMQYPYSIPVTISCHIEQTVNVSIAVKSHVPVLNSDTKQTEECSENGKTPYEKDIYDDSARTTLSEFTKLYVSSKNLALPLNDTKLFQIHWITPGTTKFTEQKCSLCNQTKAIPEAKHVIITHTPVEEHPVATNGTFTPNQWHSFSFSFTQTGSARVRFTRSCDTKTYQYNGEFGSQEISIPGCGSKHVDYYLDIIGVASVSGDGEIESVEEDVNNDGNTETVLLTVGELPPVAPSSTPEREAQTITITASPSGGSSFPSVHPEYGNIDNKFLSSSEIAAKENYGYPSWSVEHVGCENCSSAHFETTVNDNNSAGINFKGKATGLYKITATCGNSKSQYVRVCDPNITITFPNPNDETLTCQPCNPGSKIFVINANTYGLNANQKLKIEIKKPDDEELYEAYLAVRLADGTIKSVPFPIKGSEGANLLNVNGSWYGELVVKPLVQAEEGESVETYTVTAKYADESVNVPTASKDCEVIWDECADGSCQTGIGGAGIRRGGRGKRSVGTSISARPSSVYGNFTMGKNSSGKVSGSFGFSSENLSLTSLSDSFKVQTVNGTVCGKDANGRVIWTKNGKTASVIDYTDTSISGTNVLTQVRVRQFFTSDTSADTAPTIPSSLVSDATFTLNVSGNTANGISVSNTTYNGTLSQTESWSFSRPEVLLSSWGLNYSGYDCWQENQSGTITVSGEKYVTSGGNTYRYSFNAIGTSTALAKVTSQIEQLFSWGYSTISETDGNKTTTYTYNSGEYEQLASVRNPDGSRTSYTYDNEGNIATESNVTGTLTKVTTYARSAIDADNIRTVTVESRIDGTVVSKRSYQEIIGVSAESEDAPASYTLNSIQYNGTQTFTTATTYTKRTNLHGNKVYSVTKRTNVNGTENRYSYVISGDTEITTTENGVFNNDSLTLGTRQTSTVNRDGATLSTASFFVDSANNINVQTSSTVNSNFDEFGRAGTTTYLDGSTVTRTYGCCGVASETDRDGVTTTYAYDEFKRVSHTVRDGITTLYSYDALGNQTSVTIKGKNDGEITTSKTYNNGELATSTDALGNVTSYTQSYSTSGNNTTYTETVTNPDNSTQITTSVNGQQTSVTGTAVREQTISYGVNWQKIMPQNQTVYTDMMGRNFKTVYADNTYSINYYSNKNQMVKSVTPAGRVTLVEYDALGRQIKQAIDMNANDIIDDADLVTSVAYSYGTQNGKTVSITTQTRSQGANSAMISVKKQSVDGLENWETNLNGLTTHTKLERLGGGNIRQTVTNPDGTKVVTNSTNGKVITVQSIGADNSSGITVAYTYDEFNRQAGMTQTESGTTFTTSTITYNAAGQPLTQTVNGRTTSIVYNVINRTRTITLPGDRTVTEVYHPTGELQRVSGTDTYTQEWTYDPVWGQKATLTTYKDSDTPQVTTWIYNSRGNLASKKYPNNNGPSYTYNADGNLLTRTWERNIMTSYTYDNAGRLLTQSYSDNTPGITATYDYLDRIVSLTDASGTRNFTYNTQHQLVNETIPHIMNLQSSFTYDNFGRRTSRTLQLNNTTIASAGRSYDTFGRIASISNGTDTLSYTYRPGGQLSLAGWTNGQNSAMSNQSYEYDQYNRLTGIKLNNVNEVSYTLNAKDQRTAATYANAGLWNFTYDDKGQVTGANGSSKSYTYSYDGIGNRLTANENSAVTNYTSNLLNQYTLINSVVPNYDADGNMTSSGNGWVYTYNGENRITQATKGSTTVTMAYDYAGRRISKTVTASGVIQNSYKYVYDGFKLIAVYNNNDLVMTFTWQPESLGMDVPVSMTYGGATYYYVTDGNKNVTALLDASGNRVAEYVYGPFGQTVSASGSMAQINPFRFSSEFHDDETGLVYYNYRYYSPELGRWTKRDPIEEEGELNLFAITHNNLIYGWDYLGCDSIFGDIVKHTLLVPSYVGGFVISVFSGDIFWPSEEPKFSNKGCGFLITINGIWNWEKARKDFNTQIGKLPQFSEIESNGNSLHLHNPTTIIGDFVQIAGDEIGLINITSIRAAKYINAAGDQAIKNKCKCFTIHVVAHSQGTSVFRNALPLIKEKYKKHINYIGLGGQRLANFTWGIGAYQNHINGDDLVPMINFYNPLHIEDAIFSLFDGKKSDFHWRGGGVGLFSHPWKNNYYQYLK